MISVVIPVFNQADKINECLETLATQSFKDLELVVVDDGSRDNPEAVIKNFQKKHPQIMLTFIKQANQGSNPARNRGWQEAKGDYLLFSDADIAWQPQALATLHQALVSHPEAAYAYSSFRYGSKLFAVGPISAERLHQGPCIHTSALIRRNDFPGFDNQIKRLQDWDLWLTILSRGKIGVAVEDVLFTVKTGGHISSWLPSFAYKLLPFLPQVKKYHQAEAIVRQKHGL